MRVVFDTNIYIAAALRGGFAEDIFALADKKIITLITSKEILRELKQKLLTKFEYTDEQADLLISRVKKIATITYPKDKIKVVSRDPDDNKILECAVSGNADLIVSADQDLIHLKEFKGIPIIHPKTLSYTFPKYFKNKK